MTERDIRDLVQNCGLDWHKGFMPLFDGDTTNRYAVLVYAAVAAERERWREAGWVCADGFPALIGHKPLKPGTKLYALPEGFWED